MSTHHTLSRCGRLGKVATLFCCIGFTLALAPRFSQGEETGSQEAAEPSAATSAEEVDSPPNEEKPVEPEQSQDTQPDPAEAEEQVTDSKEESDKTESDPVESDSTETVEDNEDQPGDKDASVEEERPVEEDPPKDEKKKEEPQKDKTDPKKKKKHVIGATASLMEKKSEIVFKARVDTGAKSCSLHVEKIRIDNESDTMADNIGKVIHFQLVDRTGKSQWLKSKIDSYVIIKTSNSRTRRYKVPLTFQWKNNVEKKVLVTLNNRNSMDYPLLVGRNFLRGDFVVDVELDNDD